MKAVIAYSNGKPIITSNAICGANGDNCSGMCYTSGCLTGCTGSSGWGNVTGCFSTACQGNCHTTSCYSSCSAACKYRFIYQKHQYDSNEYYSIKELLYGKQ